MYVLIILATFYRLFWNEQYRFRIVRILVCVTATCGINICLFIFQLMT